MMSTLQNAVVTLENLMQVYTHALSLTVALKLLQSPYYKDTNGVQR